MNDDAPKAEDLLEDRSSAPWLKLLREAEAAESGYHSRCDNIDKEYADLERLSRESGEREFQIFWANLEVLKPSIYSRPPNPEVTPRFKDRRELPRKAADILERALIMDFEADDIHQTLIHCRDDLARNSRGVSWVMEGKRDGALVPICEHVDRKDFRHGPARKWREVPWVARGSWLTREQVRKRFGEVPVSLNFQTGQGEDAETKGKARIWEMWHKEEGLVLWLSEDVENVLDVREPWVDFTGFFPCPRPAYGTIKPGTLLPIPDFLYYRDQISEINELTERISALSDALRMKGFYPAGDGDAASAIETAMKSTDNRAVLVPVSSLAALGGKGISDFILWLPVQEVASTIGSCIELRRQLIEDVYQITGLSDIMRGATDPKETLGAQELKSQYGSIRVQERQAEMARLARDVTRLKAEYYAENADIQQLVAMAQIDDIPTRDEIVQEAQKVAAQAQKAAMQAQQQGQPPEALQQLQQQAQAQIEQIRSTVTLDDIAELYADQRARPFMLDIETDSTIRPDEAADQKRRLEFTTTIGGFIAQTAPIVQTAPQLAPFAAAMLEYAAGGFQVSRQMDQAIDELAEKMRQLGEQPQQPDPRAEAEAEAMQRQMERDDALAQAEITLKNAQAEKAMRPDVEPISMDPKDQVAAQHKERELDLKEMELARKTAETAANFVDREQQVEKAND